MPEIMSYETWMTETRGGRTEIRSGKLTAVDKALKRYHKHRGKTDLHALQGALITWVNRKGSGWRSSIRNKKKAVERLYGQVIEVGVDPAAKRALQEEPGKLVRELFNGATIAWKSSFRGKLLSSMAKPLDRDSGFISLAAKQYKQSAATNKWGTALNTTGVVVGSTGAHSLRTTGKPGATSQAVSKLVAQVVPPGAQTEVLNAVRTLVPNFEAEFTAAVMPIAGLVTAAGATLWNTGNALNKHYGIGQARSHAERSLAGVEGRHAINAMIRILERERNADVFSAGAGLAEFGGKLAGMAMDGGVASTTAVGLAACVARLMNIIRIVYRDISEKNAANRAMKQGVDISIFETCPLVGCYLVCCAPTSVLMSMILERFGEARWMDAVERGRKEHIEPLQKKAREVINNHRFEIPKLRNYAGVVKASKKKLEEMRARKGKTGMIGGGPGDFPDGAG